MLAAPSPGPGGVVPLDIFSALSSVSDETVRSMQSSIEAHAHRLHCGLDEDPALVQQHRHAELHAAQQPARGDPQLALAVPQLLEQLLDRAEPP